MRTFYLSVGSTCYVCTHSGNPYAPNFHASVKAFVLDSPCSMTVGKVQATTHTRALSEARLRYRALLAAA